MPKWFPWILGLMIVLGVVAFFVYRKVESDLKQNLADAKTAAGDAKSATDVVGKLGDLWTSTVKAFG